MGDFASILKGDGRPQRRAQNVRAAFWLLVVAGLVASAGCKSDDAAQTPEPAKAPRFSAQSTAHQFRLLHLSDMESALLPTGTADSGHGGIARAASIAAALREKRDMPTLTLASGDSWMPAPVAGIDVDIGDGTKRNAVMHANALLGIDASALGNHEFDFGEAHLAGLIAQATYPYLSTTLTISGGPLAPLVVTEAERNDKGPWLAAWPGRITRSGLLCTVMPLAPPEDGKAGALSRCTGQVVGVVGATTETLRSLSNVTDNITMPNDHTGLLAAIQQEVDTLKAQGVTVIVLLSHLQDLRRDIALIEAGLGGVDIVVSGGSDTRLADPNDRLLPGHARAEGCKKRPDSCFPLVERSRIGEPVLLVSTDGSMTYLGQLIVAFDSLGVLTGFETRNSRPVPIDTASTLELGAQPVAAARALEDAVQNEISGRMNAFAESAYFLDGRREAVRNGETNLADLSADAMAWAVRRVLPDVDKKPVAFALRNGGGIRSPIGRVDPETSALRGGPVTPFDTASAFRFDNDIVVVEVTHEQLWLTLESTLRQAGTTRGHFPQVSSEVHLRYAAAGRDQVHSTENGHIVDIGCPGMRVVDFWYTDAAGQRHVVVEKGTLKTPRKRLRIATLKYLAGGGDGYFPGCEDKIVPVALAPDAKAPTEQSAFTDFITSQETAGEWKRGIAYGPIAATPVAARRIAVVPPPADAPVPDACREAGATP